MSKTKKYQYRRWRIGRFATIKRDEIQRLRQLRAGGGAIPKRTNQKRPKTTTSGKMSSFIRVFGEGGRCNTTWLNVAARRRRYRERLKNWLHKLYKLRDGA